MKSISKWFVALSAGLLLSGAASAVDVVATGTVKSVDAEKKEFVLTDSEGKDWTIKFGKEVVVNRGGKESSSDLKADDAVNVCYDKGTLTWTAHYILVNEGTMKDCKLVHGKFKKYDATTKEFTNTEMGNKDKTYPMGSAKVRLNMKKSEIEDIKIGDTTLAIIKTTGETMSLNALMATRKI
jgi:hypothetical protein